LNTDPALGKAERLLLVALALGRRHRRADRVAIAGGEREVDAGDDVVRRQVEAAVAEAQRLARQLADALGRIDHLDGGHAVADLAAEGAGVHQQAAAERAGECLRRTRGR
jgi:hypothetical protein